MSAHALTIAPGFRLSPLVGLLLIACGSDPAGPAGEPSLNAAATAATGIDLGGLGGANNLASAIATSGLIAGRVQAPEGWESYSAVFKEGLAPEILPHHPMAVNGVIALNDLSDGGTVAVSMDIAWTRPAGGEWRSPSELPHQGTAARAYSVNSSGIIIGHVQSGTGAGHNIGGWYITPTGAHAALWSPPSAPGDPYVMTAVPGLAGCGTHALHEINDVGTAVGWSVCSSGRTYAGRPFIRTAAGAIVPLPMGPYASIQPAGISQAGHIAGVAVATKRSFAVLLWTPAADGSYGAPQQVLEIESNGGGVFGVNSCGAVLGRRVANNDLQGFVVTPDGQVTDLYPIPGGKQPVPQAINDNGIAVGWTYVVSGKGRTELVERKATKWLVGAC